jgi:hypothetical protein
LRWNGLPPGEAPLALERLAAWCEAPACRAVTMLTLNRGFALGSARFASKGRAQDKLKQDYGVASRCNDDAVDYNCHLLGNSKRRSDHRWTDDHMRSLIDISTSLIKRKLLVTH